MVSSVFLGIERISQMISRRCLIAGNRHQRRFRLVGGGSIFDTTLILKVFG
jgi:hypothetical protein